MESVTAIQQLVNRGHYLEACARAAAALRHDPAGKLKQLYALALSKSGSPEGARDFLEPHYRANPDDPETAGILGSIYKELFKKNQQTAYAVQSRDTYMKNFAATGNHYTGINAASMSAMVMQAARSREIAARVAAGIHPETQDFWEIASLAEACLLLKDRERALVRYAQARRLAATDWGKVNSIYNQLWLLNHFIPVPKDVLALFSPPRVAAFVGHMIDRPERAQPRFPPSAEAQVRDAIRACIQSLAVQVGFCSLACGSDILFAELLLEMGGEVNAILPFKKEDFIEASLRFAGEHWVERFELLLKRAPHTFVTHAPFGQQDELFAFQSKVIFGSAMLRSQMYRNDPYLITVLSETDLQRKAGGTRDALGLWPLPANITNINPERFVSPGLSVAPEPPTALPTETPRPVYYLVRFDIGTIDAVDKRKVERIIMEAGKSEYVRIVPQDAWQLIAFRLSRPAFDFLRQMTESLSQTAGSNRWRMVVHAGPVDWNHPEESEALARLRRLSDFATPEQICCTLPFAAVIALESKGFQITFSGMMSDPDNNDEPVYQIRPGG
jgi:tetratricopeptide (TPR) repeat protein